MARLHLKSNSARELIRSTNVRSNTPSSDDGKVNLPSEIDGLSALEVAEEIDYTVPFTMRCIFDIRDNKHRCNVRFVRTGLIMKDTSGVSHGMVLEIRPSVPLDKLETLKLNGEGTLVIRMAKVPRVWTTEPFEDKHGLPTGDYKIKPVCEPKFVSFSLK